MYTISKKYIIARIWHGRVPCSKAQAYREFLVKRAVPDYESIEGNPSVYILERREGDITRFLVISFWEDIEAIKKFAGEDMEAAKYYEEDKDFLLEFEPKVKHYTVTWMSWKQRR